MVPLPPPAQPVSDNLNLRMLVSFKAGASRDDDPRKDIGKEPELLISRLVSYFLPEVGKGTGELRPDCLRGPLVGWDVNLTCFPECRESRLLAARDWMLLSSWDRRRWRMRGNLRKWKFGIADCLLPELKLGIYINIPFFSEKIGRARSRGSEHWRGR